MTNKSYFKSLVTNNLYIGNFFIVFKSCSNHPSFQFFVFKLDGSPVDLYGEVSLTPRCIHTTIDYLHPDSCKFSPYELREWCPAIFLPWTNYLHWLKYLRVALEIFVESNPILLQSC